MNIYCNGELVCSGSVHAVCDDLYSRGRGSMAGYTHFITNARRDFTPDEVAALAARVLDGTVEVQP